MPVGSGKAITSYSNNSMVGSRFRNALLGIVLSLGLSVLLWRYFGSPVFFLFVPFVPFLFGRGRTSTPQPAFRDCPECGFRTQNPEFEYCPRDGRRLQESEPSSGRDRHRPRR